MKMMHDISSFDVQVVNESAIIIVVLGQFKVSLIYNLHCGKSL